MLERDAGTIALGTAGAALANMAATKSFRDLDVWQESMMLVEEIYQLTRHFPLDERFGLTAQLRRAAISIPSNIGEGVRRKKPKPRVNHLDIALGSQGEVDVQLEISQRLGFCSRIDYERIRPRIDRVGRMLNGLIASIRPASDELP